MLAYIVRYLDPVTALDFSHELICESISFLKK